MSASICKTEFRRNVSLENITSLTGTYCNKVYDQCMGESMTLFFALARIKANNAAKELKNNKYKNERG